VEGRGTLVAAKEVTAFATRIAAIMIVTFAWPAIIWVLGLLPFAPVLAHRGCDQRLDLLQFKLHTVILLGKRGKQALVDAKA
jgi:hypothetical protein